MPPVLYLLDGHGLAYRAYYALTAGEPVPQPFKQQWGTYAGVYGFTSILLRIFEQEVPTTWRWLLMSARLSGMRCMMAIKGPAPKMPDEPPQSGGADAGNRGCFQYSPARKRELRSG